MSRDPGSADDASHVVGTTQSAQAMPRGASRRRGFVCLGAAVGLHSVLVIGAHAHRSHRQDAPCVIASDFVLMEPAIARAAPPPEVREPERIVRVPARTTNDAVATAAPVPEPSVAPPPAPAPVPEAAPAAAPDVVTQAPPSTFAVATSTTGGNGTSSTAATNVAGTGGSVRGTSNGQAVATVDPAPARRRYLATIAGRIGRPAYTNSMRRRQLEGRVAIGLMVDETGNVLQVRVRTSSGNAELDENALDHVRAYVASHRRLEAPPAEAAWGTRELALPYSYVFEDEDY